MRRGDLTGNRSAARSFLILRETTPFSLVKRGREIVGCWYTSRSEFGPRPFSKDPVPVLNRIRHGMIKTNDGRVAGIRSGSWGVSDVESDTLQRLSEAERDTLPHFRRRAAEHFVSSIREFTEIADVGWTPERERYEFDMVAGLNGYRGWRHDEDPDGTLLAIKALFAVRQSVVRQFLGTLDQKLVGALGMHDMEADHADELDAMLGEAWPLLDETFGKGAPLRDTILPLLHDIELIDPHLEKYAEWMNQDEDAKPSEQEQLQLMRLRKFFPSEPTDLSNEPAPGM